MSSGGKREIFNTRERAVSTDYNRTQAFIKTDMADMLRFWLLAVVARSGEESVPTGIGSPLKMMIMGGLMVRPQVGGQSLTIDAGACVVQRPDASPSADDSQAKFVDDPGVASTGVLTLTANAGGGIRIDVVECALVGENGSGAGTGETVLESDNRDIYNTTTGLFTPAAVDKVAAVRLQYRIRTGTPGGGYPGAATGWCPLMIAAVPIGATSWDDVRCWDVRPLYRDIAWADAGAKPNGVTYAHGMVYAQYDDPGTPNGSPPPADLASANNYANGIFCGVLGGRNVGGNLPAGGVDVTSSDISDGAFPSGTAWWHLYVALPYGLPRWAEYGTTPRVPGNFRGILIASHVAPNPDGTCSGTISLPTGFGFGGTVSNALRVFSGKTASGVVVAGYIRPDGWSACAMSASAGTSSFTHGTLGIYEYYLFHCVEGTDVPVGTTAVRLHMTAHITGQTHSGYGELIHRMSVHPESAITSLLINTAGISTQNRRDQLAFDGSGEAWMTYEYEMFVEPSWPGPSSSWAARTWKFCWAHQLDAFAPTLVTFAAWKLF